MPSQGDTCRHRVTHAVTGCHMLSQGDTCCHKASNAVTAQQTLCSSATEWMCNQLHCCLTCTHDLGVVKGLRYELSHQSTGQHKPWAGRKLMPRDETLSVETARKAQQLMQANWKPQNVNLVGFTPGQPAGRLKLDLGQ